MPPTKRARTAPLAVSFDFDNTLLLSEQCKRTTMREVAGAFEHGLDVLSTVPTDSRTAPPGVQVTRHTIFEGVAGGLLARGVSPPSGVRADAFGAHLCDAFSALVEKRLKEADEVPGASALLAHLAAHGVACFVNTATPQGPIDALVDAIGWRPHFRAVYGHPGTKLSNLQSAMAAAGLGGPSTLVHVGDGDNDCTAAAAAGCLFVGVRLPSEPGAPAFSAPRDFVGKDMVEVGAHLCALLGLPPPPPPSAASTSAAANAAAIAAAAAAAPTASATAAAAASAAAAPLTLRGHCCVDCGFALSEGSALWPTCEPLRRTVLRAPETTAPPGARGKQSFSLNGGSGTHLDAPAHFVAGGRSVEQLLPAELAGVPLVVVDCTSAVRAQSEGGGGEGGGVEAAHATLVSREALLADEAAHGRMPWGALVCIRTGWAECRYDEPPRYLNAPDASDVDELIGKPRMRFPGVSADAARMLVAERGAVGLGIDTLSPDGGAGGAAGFPVHHAVLGADCYLLENLRLTAALPPRGAVAFVAPLNIAGAPEAPARVWAMLP